MRTLGDHTTCHFVPPYLMQELADTGTLDQDYVDACLRIDTDMRAQTRVRPRPDPPPRHRRALDGPHRRQHRAAAR